MIPLRNDFLKAEEEKDFLRRNVDMKESSLSKISERIDTIPTETNLKASGETVHDMLKFRMETEQEHDYFKNIMH